MKWVFRWFYEKFNIYIYIIIPLSLILLLNDFNNDIFQEVLKQYSLEFSITFSVYFLCFLGALVTIPSSEALALLQRYKHIQIVFFTLAIGNICSLLLLKYHEYSFYIFITIITEAVIATIKMYRISKFINKKNTFHQ